MTRTVFVTGGCGYVGAHCCKAFATAGWNVVTYDNLSRGWREFAKWGPLIEGDILDYSRLQHAMAEAVPDAVVHFAAMAYVGESVVNPGLYYQINTAGTINVLSAMRSIGVDKIVFSSSCATYGKPNALPIEESHAQFPINPYGWSKLFVEQILRDLGSAHGIRSVALRYFNAAGADSNIEIGERHDPETHLIPLAIRGAMAEDFELTVFGDDFNTRDGSCVRDYIHVTDLADGHLKALEHVSGSLGFDAFNLGTGIGTSVFEIADAVERLTGRPVRRKIGPRRPGDPDTLIASSDRARHILGWRPQYSDIDTIIQDAYRWHMLETGGGRTQSDAVDGMSRSMQQAGAL